MQTIIQDLAAIQQKAKQGSFLREGITAVIAGEPNVGKSSLLNGLSGKEMAIVTDIPGTTRDVLRDTILIDGMPMHILDTAGLRESDDVVEQEGIRRAYREIEKADLILFVMAANQSHQLAELPTFPQPTLYIRNKIDLMKETPQIENTSAHTVISLSAKSGEGLDLLRTQIKQLVGFQPAGEGVYLARRRHLDALQRAQTFIEASLYQLTTNHSGELAAEDLRLAHHALCEITGEFTADDLLGRIFSSFCIGK